MSRDAGRLGGLDLLRGLAVVAVLIRHVQVQPKIQDGISEQVLNFFFQIGWMGVDLFFVLSGFLIAGLLFKEIRTEGKLNLLRFWFRRGMKIWPCYFLVFGTYVGLNLWQAKRLHNAARVDNLISSLLPNCLFYQNYTDNSWPATWSIAVEEHFYFLLPLLIAILAAVVARLPLSRGAWNGAAMTAGCAALVLAILFRWLTVAYGDGNTYSATHLRFDSLLTGVLLRYVHDFIPGKFESAARWSRWLCPVLLGAAFVLVYQNPIDGAGSGQLYVFLYSLNNVAFASLVALSVWSGDFARSWPIAGWPLRVMSWIGVSSYTIYLVHAVIFNIPWTGRLEQAYLRWFGPAESYSYIWTFRLTHFVMSILAGYLVAKWVEQPILRWRDRVWPSKRRQEPATTPQPVLAKAA